MPKLLNLQKNLRKDKKSKKYKKRIEEKMLR